MPSDDPKTTDLLPYRSGEIAAARAYRDASRAASTRKQYDADWGRFHQWCRTRGIDSLPAAPPTVAVYLSTLADAGLTPPTVARAMAGIGHRHRQAGLLAPHRAEGGGLVLEVLAGIRRSRGSVVNRKQAADADIVMQLLWGIEGDSLRDVRDRAVIAFGMAMAARRSELVALDLADLAFEADGVRVTIWRSKTDQEREGQVIAVPEGSRLRPLHHLREWLIRANIEQGAVFRAMWKGDKLRDGRLSDRAVAMIVQDRAAAAGLDPARFGGHSLRAGFITAAAKARADVWKIQQVSRHKSIQVLSGYVRDAKLFDGHAGEGFL